MNHKSIYPFLLCITLALPVFFALHADFNRSNTLSIKRLISYRKDSKGFYVKEAPQCLDNLKSDSLPIAKNNKTKSIFILRDHALYRVDLSKDAYKEYKKDKAIQNLDEKELLGYQDNIDSELSEYFHNLNILRHQFLADSIREAEKIEAERRQRIADSLENDRRIRLDNEKYEEYRQMHNPYVMRNGDNEADRKQNKLSCSMPDCDYSTSDKDLYLLTISADSLIFFSKYDNQLLWFDPPLVFHTAPIPEYLKKSDALRYHLKAFRDSIPRKENISFRETTEQLNYESFYEYFQKVKKAAPNGFIEDYSWGDEYGVVSMNLSYMNTSDKTMKYITAYFSITNDVGDVRTRGHVKGTGPVHSFSTASWDWDYTGYFTSGDATKMRITKLVITYMDGTTKTLTGKSIIYAP